ncbi:winged helix-turn-helix transcriptional regulator [Winogradskyella jejuensis]|uniref:Transcriptional regulator, HxlR family n=1 Tax=Winogradskyella jejuensis TaxID=1089305 RepID=A0A1M5TYZ7_9FLAO|nr:helix-turn-helix domain-containing protein [Winogradskyella jejuensis]SHH55924.1 transcriptional regulator, HxlR family [Winogradskyella jejuensis]
MIIEGEHKAYKIDENIYHCGTSVTMSFIGGKWKCVVLWYLRNGSLRFSELKRLSPYITEKMLSIQLKALQADGLIDRKSYGEKAPFRVQYTLTPFGESLIPVIEVITKWGTTLANKKGEIVDVQ